MNRPKAVIEANDALEQYEMYSEEPLRDHDDDGARQHIATIYDHEEAHEILRLWNSSENATSNQSSEATGNPFKDIPSKFYKGEDHPIARTVGELKAALDELPDDLRCEAGFGEAMKLVVYNHGTSDEHLEILEHDEDGD